MTTAWNHLPNAAPIDRIIANFKINPTKWYTAISTERKLAIDAALDEIEKLMRVADSKAVADELIIDQDFLSSDIDNLRGSIPAAHALIAWDDCAHLLDCDPEHVKSLAELGNHAAVLLYTACLILQEEIRVG